MFTFPKTDKGIRSRIAAYKASMQKERRAYGFISDGYGKRYLIFWLYFVLGDLQGANAYLRWYEKTFEDDIGEPIHELCVAIMLHRSGKNQKAKYSLAELMLSNLYVIPKILGEQSHRHRIWHGSNYAEAEYAEEIPQEILSAITDDDRSWIRESHDSAEFRRYREQYIDIQGELDRADGVAERAPLVRKSAAILDELKKSCG